MSPNRGKSQGIKKETNFVSFYSQEEENREKGEKKNEIFIPLKSLTEFLLAPAGLRLQRLSERMNYDFSQLKHKNQHTWPKLGKILAHNKSQWCLSKEQRGKTETNPNPQMLTAQEHNSSSAQPWTTNPCFALFNSVRTSSHLTEPGGERL